MTICLSKALGASMDDVVIAHQPAQSAVWLLEEWWSEAGALSAVTGLHFGHSGSSWTLFKIVASCSLQLCA